MSSQHIRFTMYIFVDNDEELLSLYKDKAVQHNNQCMTNPFPDAGFDLFCPQEQECIGSCHKVDYKVKCALFEDIEGCIGRGFYLYPRSSISKTNFRLANNVGIIDSGYRGNIGAYFDTKTDKECILKHQRLVQLCSPTLEPFYIKIVEQMDDLPGAVTERGSGGFGSTNIEPLLNTTLPPPSPVIRSNNN